MGYESILAIVFIALFFLLILNNTIFKNKNRRKKNSNQNYYPPEKNLIKKEPIDTSFDDQPTAHKKNDYRHDKYLDLPYKLKKYIFTKNEFNFYKALVIAVGDKAVICPKIGIKDFIYIEQYIKGYMSYWGKISQKHIDFLLCDPVYMTPVCGIELDDDSHNEAHVVERDNLVNAIYKNAKLPLFRFKARYGYNPEDIRESLKSVLPLT